MDQHQRQLPSSLSPSSSSPTSSSSSLPGLGRVQRSSRLFLLLAMCICSQILLDGPSVCARSAPSTSTSKQQLATAGGGLESSSNNNSNQIQSAPRRNSTGDSDSHLVVNAETTTSEQHAQQKKRDGQLEWFSMEMTGLGDLEEPDAIRKMMRRSHYKDLDDGEQQREQQQPGASVNARAAYGRLVNELYQQLPNRQVDDQAALLAAAWATALSNPWRNAQTSGTIGDRLPAAQLFERKLRRKLANLREGDNSRESSSMLSSLPPGQDESGGQPEPRISISRRTAEELNDDSTTGSSDEGAEDSASRGLDGDLDEENLGEFSSRISLLTTRKIQPEPFYADVGSLNRLLDNLVNASRRKQLSGAPEEGAKGPVNMKPPGLKAAASHGNYLWPALAISGLRGRESKGHDQQQQEQQPIMTGSSSNYLPRIARALPM